jgi:hypothetical protein
MRTRRARASRQTEHSSSPWLNCWCITVLQLGQTAPSGISSSRQQGKKGPPPPRNPRMSLHSLSLSSGSSSPDLAGTSGAIDCVNCARPRFRVSVWLRTCSNKGLSLSCHMDPGVSVGASASASRSRATRLQAGRDCAGAPGALRRGPKRLSVFATSVCRCCRVPAAAFCRYSNRLEPCRIIPLLRMRPKKPGASVYIERRAACCPMEWRWGKTKRERDWTGACLDKVCRGKNEPSVQGPSIWIGVSGNLPSRIGFNSSARAVGWKSSDASSSSASDHHL